MTTQKLVPFIDKDGRRHDHFYVDPRSQVLYYKKGHVGRKIKFSTRLTADEFVKAKRFANQEFERRIGRKKKTAVRTLIKDELVTWLKVKESEGLKYDTMNNVRRAAKQIEEYWGPKFPSEIGKDSIAAWIVFWKENHPDIDMENAVKYMRNFCRYLAQKVFDGKPLIPVVPDIIDPNYKKIRRRRKKKKERIILSSEFNIIYKTAPDRVIALVALIMYTMATRITETLTMRFGQEILLGGDMPIYRWSDGQNKADHDGWHALHPSLIEPLRKLEAIRRAEGTDRLFPQILDNSKALHEQQIEWEEWRKRANLSWHWTPHTFRHTCLSNLFNDPKNPQALICKLYRVSLATALETYIKPTREGIDRMKTAIEVDL